MFILSSTLLLNVESLTVSIILSCTERTDFCACNSVTICACLNSVPEAGFDDRILDGCIKFTGLALFAGSSFVVLSISGRVASIALSCVSAFDDIFCLLFISNLLLSVDVTAAETATDNEPIAGPAIGPIDGPAIRPAIGRDVELDVVWAACASNGLCSSSFAIGFSLSNSADINVGGFDVFCVFDAKPRFSVAVLCDVERPSVSATPDKFCAYGKLLPLDLLFSLMLLLADSRYCFCMVS